MNSFGVLVSGISNPLGLLLGGWIIEETDPPMIYIGIGGIIITMGLASTIIRPFRNEAELTSAAGELGV